MINNTKPNLTPIPQGRPPASESEGRRERILDNALSLFAEHGIAGTTVAQIGKASGVTPAMVHYYFDNREGLLDAIAAERLAPALAYIFEGFSDEVLADPRRMITELIDRLLEAVERMPQIPPLWSREVFNAGGLLRERVLSLVPMERFAAVSRALSLAQQEGNINAKVLAPLVITSALALIMIPLTAFDMADRIPTMPPLDKETLRRHALSLLLDGLCPQNNRKEHQ